MEDKIKQLEKEKHNAYWERNQLVAALSKLFPSYLAKHPKEDKEWEDDWRNIVFISIPAKYTFGENATGPVCDYQLSWHIHDSDLPLFDHLQLKDNEWDGHTTETKYWRLRRIQKQYDG